MIHSFTCKNFYSFAGENTVNFQVNQKAPKNDGYFVTPSKTRLSKVETIIGPNASGKTNLLKILPLFKWLVINSFNANPDKPLPVKTFILAELKNEPIELSVNFEIETNIYTYNFKLSEEKILEETLFITNKTKEKVTTKKLFSREWNKKNNSYTFNGKNFELPKNFENLLRKNASIISTAMRLNHKTSQIIGNYWGKVETNVIEAGWIGDSLLPNAKRNLVEALFFYSENEKLKKEAEKLLSRFDLGLESFCITKEKNENGVTINVKATHFFEDKKLELPFQYESAGTKQLFIILKTILQVLATGGIAVLDEFDVNLHPEMIMELHKLFISPETNTKQAQMIFSSHSHQILGELDKYQIILTEKNKKGSSETWRLDEMTGVRADDNYYTKYIAGAYGAIPNIN